MAEEIYGNLEVRVVGLRSSIQGTLKELFDDPRMTQISLDKPVLEFQIELPNLMESYPQIKDLKLSSIDVQKNRWRGILLSIRLNFDNLSFILMEILEKNSRLKTELKQTKGYTVTLVDDTDTPIAECLRLQLIQEGLDLVARCRDVAKGRD